MFGFFFSSFWSFGVILMWGKHLKSAVNSTLTTTYFSRTLWSTIYLLLILIINQSLRVIFKLQIIRKEKKLKCRLSNFVSYLLTIKDLTCNQVAQKHVSCPTENELATNSLEIGSISFLLISSSPGMPPSLEVGLASDGLLPQSSSDVVSWVRAWI